MLSRVVTDGAASSQILGHSSEMGKGSQLTQLKSSLAQAGLSRQSQPSSSSKKRKRSGSASANGSGSVAEKQDKARKLEEISRKLNPFDVKVTKLKMDVGGRKVKGVVGRPAASRQEGLEKVSCSTCCHR